MAYFDLRTFINENNLGAYSRLKEDTVSEQSAFVLAADAARDAGKDEFEFPKGSGKMHKVSLKQDIPVEEGVGGEMAEILGAFLALVGAGKTALEAVKILGDEHGDISISSIKDAIKQYKSSKKIGEELSDEEADKFHTKLDTLVHKTFGPSSDEENMNEEMGMEYEYDDLIGPLMKSMVDMEKWVAQYASDDTEAVQLLQLATNALENFDNYMSYGTEMNEGAEGEWPKSTTSKYSDEYEFRLVKVEPTYQGKPGRAKYEVIDLESGEVKGTQVYTSPNSLKLAAADLIKPQGGTQSTNLGEINLSDAL